MRQLHSDKALNQEAFTPNKTETQQTLRSWGTLTSFALVCVSNLGPRRPTLFDVVLLSVASHWQPGCISCTCRHTIIICRSKVYWHGNTASNNLHWIRRPESNHLIINKAEQRRNVYVQHNNRNLMFSSLCLIGKVTAVRDICRVVMQLF